MKHHFAEMGAARVHIGIKEVGSIGIIRSVNLERLVDQRIGDRCATGIFSKPNLYPLRVDAGEIIRARNICITARLNELSGSNGVKEIKAVVRVTVGAYHG